MQVRVSNLGPSKRRVAARIIMDARAADVWRIITGYGDFKNYSPNIVGSDVLAQKRGQAVLDLTQKCAGLPFHVRYA